MRRSLCVNVDLISIFQSTQPQSTTTRPTTPGTGTTSTLDVPTSIQGTSSGTLPPPGNCEEPDCTDCEDGEVLFPHIDPHYFWQCASGRAVRKVCPPGLWFEYYKQACVYCEDWTNVCGIIPPPRPTYAPPQFNFIRRLLF